MVFGVAKAGANGAGDAAEATVKQVDEAATKVDFPDLLAPSAATKAADAPGTGAVDDAVDAASNPSTYDAAKAWVAAHKRGLAVGAGVVALGGIAAYGLSNRGDSDAPAGTGAGAVTGAGKQTGAGAVTGEGQESVTGNAPNNAFGGYGSIPSGSVQSTSLVSDAYMNELKEAQAIIATSNINKVLQEAQNFQQHFVSYPQAPTPSSTVPSEPAVASGKIVYSGN